MGVTVIESHVQLAEQGVHAVVVLGLAHGVRRAGLAENVVVVGLLEAGLQRVVEALHVLVDHSELLLLDLGPLGVLAIGKLGARLGRGNATPEARLAAAEADA